MYRSDHLEAVSSGFGGPSSVYAVEVVEIVVDIGWISLDFRWISKVDSRMDFGMDYGVDFGWMFGRSEVYEIAIELGTYFCQKSIRNPLRLTPLSCINF